VRRTGAEGSSTTARCFGKLGSGLSVGLASRRGSERARRGVASPRYSSSASSNEAGTIRSRIRRHRERSLLRKEEEITPWLCKEEDAVSSVGCSSSRPQQTLSRINSGDTYNISSSSGTASSFTYTSHTVSSASSASASSYSYCSPVTRRGRARPSYASDKSDLSRNCHRHQQCKERKERREERLRRLTKKIAMVFHHRHDHHHHQPGSQESPPSRSDRCELNRNDKSPWKHLGGMLHCKKGKDKKAASQRAVAVSDRCKFKHNDKSPWKHLGGMYHRKNGKDKKKMGSRVQVNKKRHRKE
jgi:hypothetical protein